MSDRQTQAIFAAIKAFNGGTNAADANARHGFMAGVQWADANPQPRTITADQCNDIEDAVHEGVPLGHMLRRLGIEVRDE